MALDVVGASSQSTLLAHSKAVSDSLDGLTDSQSGGLMLRLSSVGTSGIANGLADTRVSGAATDTLLMALDVVGPSSQSTLLADSKSVGSGIESLPGGESSGFVLGFSCVGASRIANSLADTRVSGAATDTLLMALDVVGPNGKTVGGLTDSEGGCLNLSGVGTCDVAHSLAGAGISSAATDAVSVAFHVVGSNSKTLGSGIDD